MAARIGHRQPVEGMIGDSRDHGIVGGAVGEAGDSGGEGEQAEQPDGGKQRQQREDIGLRLGAPDGHQRDGRGDQPARNQKHQKDAAAPALRLVGHRELPEQIMVDIDGHGGKSALSA